MVTWAVMDFNFPKRPFGAAGLDPAVAALVLVLGPGWALLLFPRPRPSQLGQFLAESCPRP